MKMEVQFGGYAPVTVDTTNGTCGVFERLTPSAAAAALETAAMGDADDDGWIAATIGGEECQLRETKMSTIDVLSANDRVIMTSRGTMSWGDAIDAATQIDAALAAQYRVILAAAWKMHPLPLTVSHLHDGSPGNMSYWSELRLGGVRVAKSPEYRTHKATMATRPRDVAAMRERVRSLGLD